MASARITLDDKDVRAALARLVEAGADMSVALADVGEHLLNAHRERVAAQCDPQGNPWEPLSEKYRAGKWRNADKILILDSYLKDLLRYQLDAGGTSLEFGTDRIYA
jgi:hypothetical protein